MRNLVRYRRNSGHGWTFRWVAPVANDPYETWVEEPTRQHSVVIWDNMYFLDLAANRRVERH